MTDGTPEGGFLERLRNSPRTVSTIIVILIVVGAIFAFSDRGEQPAGAPTASPTATDEGAATASPAPEGTATPTSTKATPAPTPLPEAKETADVYEEVAQRGDGVTHLTRRALHRALEAQKPDFEVTAEHKVWIEDYVKDHLGRQALAVGQSLPITKELVREGIEKSKSLTDAQRQNLRRYARLVAAYR